MGQKYLIDSNVIIDYVAGLLPVEGSDFVEQIFNQEFLTSVIVKIEVLGFDDVPHKMSAMEEFIAMAKIIPLDEKVTNTTINMRRKYKKLKLGDAIIASTALEHNLILITGNIADFKNIHNLTILNPYQIL
jgi:predicted nucleic acid-binding protein